MGKKFSLFFQPMASLDFKDAYYSVKIHPDFKKCFKFSYKGTLYKYRALPNGLCTCPRKFTKMMKPPLAFLRQCGHIISGYIDDQYLQGKTQQKCIANVIAAITLFENLGLVIHPEKSVIVPQQRLVFLGFIIDSVLMTVSLTQDKITKIKTLPSSLLDNSFCVNREVAYWSPNFQFTRCQVWSPVLQKFRNKQSCCSEEVQHGNKLTTWCNNSCYMYNGNNGLMNSCLE